MSSTLAITRITHSCHLIEIGGLTLLTDPWFSEKPAYHPGEPIALAVAELPRLDGVLISHHHYDHCDLDELQRYPDKTVPLFVCAPVAKRAAAHGFSNVTVLRPWEAATVGPVTITAAPAKHAVEEITFVICSDQRTVYFAADTLYIPELDELPSRFPKIDLALVPTNGLRIRPLFNRKIVMDGHDAARLIAMLQPAIAIPHHYAFTSGLIADRLLTKADSDPQTFVTAANQLAPEIPIAVINPGQRLIPTLS